MGDAQAPSYLPHAHVPGYLTQDEHSLRLTAWCAIPGVTLTLAFIIVDDTGCPGPMTVSMPLVGARAKETFPPFAVEKGRLASLHVFAAIGSPIGSQCFARVELLQGREGGVTSLGTIAEGYVTANDALAYPGDNTSRSVDGRGTFRIINGTAPVAGAEILETVPVNTRWMLTAFRFRFTASAAVANRTPVLLIDDGANVVFETENVTAVTAAQVVTYNAGAGIQNANLAALDYQIALPETLLLPAGARIRTLTGAKDAADQYAAPVYNVEEWLDV